MMSLAQPLLVAQFAFFVFAAVFSLTSLRLEKSASDRIFAAAIKSVWAGAIISLVLLGILAYAFASNDFSIYAVASHSGADIHRVYKVSALWAGAPGSFLLWSTMLFAIVAFWGTSLTKKEQATSRTSFSLASLICAIFAAILLFVLEPFAPTPYTADAGSGLNPLLQNFWMVIHPPLLFAGYSLFAIPFVQVIAAVATGAIADHKIFTEIRPYLLLAFVFLTAGIATGAKWAYVELGWGGFWAWDPVENASIVPWLITLAAIHCLAITRKTGSCSRLTIAFIPAPFVLCLIATFITRSGIVQSVHSFDSGTIASVLVIVICFFTGLWGASAFRATRLLAGFDKKHLSLRARFMLIASLVLVFYAAVIFAATFWPVFSRVFTSISYSPARQFYDNISVVIIISLLLLLILAGSYNWTRTKRAPAILISAAIVFVMVIIADFVFASRVWHFVLFDALCFAAVASTFMTMRDYFRSRHWLAKSASIVSHLGLIILAASISVLTFGSAQRELSLAPGRAVNIGHYSLVYTSFRHEPSVEAVRVGPLIEIHKDSHVSTIWPHNAVYSEDMQIAEIGLSSWPFEDIYVVFKGIDEKSNAIVDVQIKPMMNFIWSGMTLIIAGSVTAFLSRRVE